MLIAIITISKNNELYLDEWITYHTKIGINKIFFLDNNEPSDYAQIEVIQKYSNCEWIDIRGVHLDTGSSIGNLQKKYFTELFYKHRVEYDWFAFIDIDEFIHTDKPLQEFICQPCFEDTLEIILNWKCYDDNDLVFYDNRSIQERFTRPYLNTTCYSQPFPENEICKCLLSNKADVLKHNVHTVTIKGIGNIKNALGHKIHEDWRQTPIIHDAAYIKHYETKSLQEYITNRIIHKQCSKQEFLNRITWFFNVNKHTAEKDEIIQHLLHKFK